ncbi:MAG: PilZ domain-containing protein [Croceibacterium sp.]
MKYEPIVPREATTESELRGHARHTFDVIAEIKIGWGVWQKARLLDVSSTGFRLGRFPQETQDADIRIRIPGLAPLAAKIRWREDSAVGCQFVNPLSIYVLEHVAEHAAG